VNTGTAIRTHRVCGACAVRYPLWGEPLACSCGAPLALAGAGTAPGAGLWRYGRLLPPVPAAQQLSLGETATPLVALRGLRAKLDCLLPTGSFKDRGSAVLASAALASGATAAVADSSGNAGASLAAYFAVAGIPLTVFVPASASGPKVAQARRYGAAVVAVDGDRAAVAAEADAFAARTGAFYASHGWSPFFVAGVRTLAAELLEQLDEPPRDVVVPVGAGTLLLGVHQGFALLRELGEIERVPRLHGVQASDCAPLADAFARRLADVDATRRWRPSIAEGINIVRAPRASEILGAVHASGGSLLAVDADAIVAARDELARAGVLVETTSATAWAGARALELEDAVVVLTGFGLKEEL
jgi:threonine synthase